MSKDTQLCNYQTTEVKIIQGSELLQAEMYKCLKVNLEEMNRPKLKPNDSVLEVSVWNYFTELKITKLESEWSNCQQNPATSCMPMR